MVEWKFKLSIPGSDPIIIGNFAAQITFLTINSFYINSGFTGDINAGDTIIITNSSINGTYLVSQNSSEQTIYVDPAIAFFSGSENIFIEIIRPSVLEVIIPEPIGFTDIVFNTLRDDIWHGIFFEASTSQLQFYGKAFDILKDAKQSYGVDADVTFMADSKCEGENEFTNVITGKLNFANYQETCGTDCFVRLSVEQESCAMLFKNRFDQKVNIDSNVAFDKITNIPSYDGIRFNMQLATQEIPISADAQVSLDGDVVTLSAIELYASAPPNHQDLMMRPTYSRVVDNSIKTGSLDDAINVFQDPGDTFLLTPQLLLEELPQCINAPFTYSVRLKGNLIVNTIASTGTSNISLWAIMDYWDGIGIHHGPGNLTGDAIELHRELCLTSIAGDGSDNLFDKTFTGTVVLPEGVGVYAYIKVVHVAISGVDADITADFEPHWDPETSFYMANDQVCPPSDCDVYLVNETLAHVTESITDACLTVKSDYYGRTDSQPFTSDIDGCGGLRVVTPGLKIRQAEDKQFFASMKELMYGLRAIDNIGMGMEGNTVRIEPAKWFYNDSKIMEILLIPKSTTEIDESKIYSNILCGYNKWEIKSIKGIDEFNSYKERRTGIKSINNQLDITCDLIASGYVIANLRTDSLVNSGNADSTYDNDVFIICVDRDAYGFHVEQGVTDGNNFYSPATAYNWRIRPLYNVMRWFNSIANCYVNYLNTNAKIFFTQGKGNYLASGQIDISDPCRLENAPYDENKDIDYSLFNNTDDFIPYLLPEDIKFNYPLSIKDYKAIKENPYGYINIQCGNGSVIKSYIKSIEYKPASGTADFILIKAWH